eukprot:2239747-Prorocentrum_lima.AAC.1
MRADAKAVEEMCGVPWELRLASRVGRRRKLIPIIAGDVPKAGDEEKEGAQADEEADGEEEEGKKSDDKEGTAQK